MRKLSSVLYPIGPKSDASGNAIGHYMIVDPRVKIGSIRADLTTNTTAVNQLKRSYFTCRMTFQYYMSANALKKDSTYFAVTVGSNIRSARTVWRMTAQVLDQWTSATAAIGDQVGMT